MEHYFIRHKLSEYIDGTVSDAEKAEIEKHLASCEKCSNALEELRKTVEHIKRIEEVEPPAWMTQKIMAKVRVEAEQRRSLYEKLYAAFVVKLPVKAVAVVFLAAIAFYMYRGILLQSFSRAPLPETAVKKEAAPVNRAKNEPVTPGESARRSSRVPQAPGYKALDMKDEYGKLAPPLLADKMAAAPARPAEHPAFAKKEAAEERRAFAPLAEAPVTAENRAASSTEVMQQAGAKRKSAEPSLLARSAAPAKSGSPAIILRVADLKAAAREVEQALAQLGGSITGKENPGAKTVYTVSIDAQKLQDLKTKLRLIGEVKDEAGAPPSLNTRVELKIEIIANAVKPR